MGFWRRKSSAENNIQNNLTSSRKTKAHLKIKNKTKQTKQKQNDVIIVGESFRSTFIHTDKSLPENNVTFKLLGPVRSEVEDEK